MPPVPYAVSIKKLATAASAAALEPLTYVFTSIITSMARNRPSLLCADVPLRNYSLTALEQALNEHPGLCRISI